MSFTIIIIIIIIIITINTRPHPIGQTSNFTSAEPQKNQRGRYILLIVI